MIEQNSDSSSSSNYEQEKYENSSVNEYENTTYSETENETNSQITSSPSKDISSDSIESPSSNLPNSETENSDSIEDPNNLEKMILSTGIRVGTPIKTKFMSSFITRANPEGLYILDISKTLARIDVAAKFIGRTNIANVAVTSSREYGKTPIEKFCELTGARGIFGRFMPGTFTNPSLPKYLEPEIVIVTDPQADEQAGPRSN